MRNVISWFCWGWMFVFLGLLAVAARLILVPFEPLPADSFRQREILEKIPYASGFDFPVGWPDAKGYYDARSFGVKGHMGSDWNGVNGENTDLGDPIYATSDGMVIFSGFAGAGWGDCIILAHRLPGRYRDRQIDSLYAHVQDRLVQEGEVVKRGQKIGTIGSANGRYFAHLHFEIRHRPWMGVRSGYNERSEWWYNPTRFIRDMRKQEQLAKLNSKPKTATR